MNGRSSRTFIWGPKAQDDYFDMLDAAASTTVGHRGCTVCSGERMLGAKQLLALYDGRLAPAFSAYGIEDNEAFWTSGLIILLKLQELPDPLECHDNRHRTIERKRDEDHANTLKRAHNKRLASEGFFDPPPPSEYVPSLTPTQMVVDELKLIRATSPVFDEAYEEAYEKLLSLPPTPPRQAAKWEKARDARREANLKAMPLSIGRPFGGQVVEDLDGENIVIEYDDTEYRHPFRVGSSATPEPNYLDPAWAREMIDSDDEATLRMAIDAVASALQIAEDQQAGADGYSLVGMHYNPDAARNQYSKTVFGDAWDAFNEEESSELSAEIVDAEWEELDRREQRGYATAHIEGGAGCILTDADVVAARFRFREMVEPFISTTEARFDAEGMSEIIDREMAPALRGPVVEDSAYLAGLHAQLREQLERVIAWQAHPYAADFETARAWEKEWAPGLVEYRAHLHNEQLDEWKRTRKPYTSPCVVKDAATGEVKYTLAPGQRYAPVEDILTETYEDNDAPIVQPDEWEAAIAAA
jgi:hypothetical protein